MQFQVRHLIIYTYMTLFVGLVVLGDAILPSNLSTDSNIIMELAEDPSIGGELSKSYRNTGLFFASIPSAIHPILLSLLGCGILWIFLNRIKNIPMLMLGIFLTLPAVLMAMIRPQKEIFVMLLSFLCLYIVQNTNFKPLHKIGIICLLYAVYVLFMREYYTLIIIAFIGTLFFIYTNWFMRLLIIFSFIALLFAVPDGIFEKLQGARDMMNLNRVGTGEVGNRTAFFNPYPPTNVVNFLLNYGYALVKLNLSIVFEFGIKELFLTCSIFLYGWLCWLGLRSKTMEGGILTPLFIGHFLVLMLFEPDLGTYFRHISSVFLYLLPGVLLLDKQIKFKA